MRSDLPENRVLRRDVLILEELYGLSGVHWDRVGGWVQVDHFPISSSRYELSHKSTYVVLMVPEDYGERAGVGAGLEECYVDRDLRIKTGASWVEVPHTHVQLDRRGGAAVRIQHRYACVHVDWDPSRDNVLTSLKLLRLMFDDPWTFAKIGTRA